VGVGVGVDVGVGSGTAVACGTTGSTVAEGAGAGGAVGIATLVWAGTASDGCRFAADAHADPKNAATHTLKTMRRAMTQNGSHPVVYWAGSPAAFLKVVMKRNIAQLAALLLAIALLAGACFGGGDSDGLAVSTEPTATPFPTPLPTVDSTQTGIEVGNDEATEEGVDADTTPLEDLEDPEAIIPDDVDLTKPAFNELSKISTVGLDEIFFGMTAADAADAAGTAWDPDRPTSSTCWLATPVNGPVGVEFMMIDGGVERVEITTELITTRSGAGVGSTADELRALWGDLLDESDPALLQFVPQDEEDANFRIMFTMVDGAVESYRAGRLPIVEYPTCP
jgi:hypothetical protein